MAVVTGPVYIPAPNPVIPRYGLFKAATGPLDLPRNARSGGVQYQTSTCNLPNGYEVNCQAEHASKTLESSVATVSGSPFVVYSAIRCGAVGLVNDLAQVNKHLFDQLVAGEQATVERLFSTQTFGQAPGLGGNPNVVNLGSAAGVVTATGLLEDWLYTRYGLPGVLHVPMEAAAFYKGAHLLVEPQTAGTWRTDVGTAVSFGNYAGTGPTGQVPGAGTTWIFITGQVAIWRTPDSDLFVPTLGEVINRATNVVTVVMEREYVVTFDCYIAAIQVTLTDTSH